METEEITLRVPKDWKLTLTSLAESADYPSLNAMLLELVLEAFEMPLVPWMPDRIDQWWEMV